MSGSGQEALSDAWEWSETLPVVQEALSNVRECSEAPPGCLRTSRMSVSGRETLPDVPEWWEALLNVRQLSGGLSDVRGWPGGPRGCPRVVKSLSKKFGRPSRCP